MNIKQTMAERLAQAATDTTAQHLTDSSKQAAEKLASDGKMLRAQLGEILGVSESEIPSWYLDSNPHLIMRMQDSNTLAANPVVKHEMRHHYEQAVSIRQAQDAEDMANEYRALLCWTITDTAQQSLWHISRELELEEPYPRLSPTANRLAPSISIYR